LFITVDGDVDASSASSVVSGAASDPVTVSVTSNPGSGCEASRRAMFAYEFGL